MNDPYHQSCAETSGECYSNLACYGSQGRVEPIVAPYPAEQVPQILLAAQTHSYSYPQAQYVDRTPAKCGNYKNMTQICNQAANKAALKYTY